MKRLLLTALIIATGLPAFGQGWTVIGNPVSLCQGGDPLWILWNDTPYNASNNIYSDVSELGVPPLTYPVITLTMLTNLPPTGALNTNAWINYYIRYGTNGTDWLGTNGYSDGSDFAIGNNVRFLDHNTNAPGALTVSFPDNVIGGTTGQWYFAAVAQTIGTNGTFDRGYYNTNCIGCQPVTNGSWLWDKEVTEFGIGGVNPSGLAVDRSNNVIQAGWFQGGIVFADGSTNYALPSPALLPPQNSLAGNTFIVKYNAAGTMSWRRCFGESDYNSSALYQDVKAFDVVSDSSGNIIVIGSFYGTNDFSGVGNSSGILVSKVWLGNASLDMFVSKYDPNGNFLWAKAISGSYSDGSSACLAVDTNDDIIISGSFTSPDLDFGNGIVLAATGAQDVCLAKLSGTDGAAFWAVRNGAGGYCQPRRVKVDKDNNVLMTMWGGVPIQKRSGSDGHVLLTKALTVQIEGIASNPTNGDIIVSGEFSAPTDFGDGNTIDLLGELGLFMACYSGSTTNLLWLRYTSGIGGLASDITVSAAGRMVLVGKGTTGLYWNGAFPNPPTHTIPLSYPQAFSAVFSLNAGTNQPTYLFGRYTSGLGYISNAVGFRGGLDASGNVYVGGSYVFSVDCGGGTRNGVPNANSAFAAKYRN